MKNITTDASVALIGILSSAGLAEGQIQFQKIIEAGDPVPEIPGVTLKRVAAQYYGNDSFTTFDLTLEGAGVTSANDQATMYFTAETGLRLIARESPSFSYVGVNTIGVAISIIEKAVGSSSLYTHRTWSPDGAPSVSLPLYPLGPHSYFSAPGVRMLTQDTAVFSATTDLTEDHTDAGIWSTDLVDGVTEIMHSGDFLPELGSEFVDRVSIADIAGERVLITITPSVQGERLPNNGAGVEVGAIYVWDNATKVLENVYTSFLPAPEIPGANIRYFNGYGFTPDGSVSFAALLENGPGGVTSDNDQVYYNWSDGVITLVSREGDPLPSYMAGLGVPGVPGAEFYSVDPEEVLPGQYLVFGRLKLGLGGINQNNDQGVWLFRDGQGELLFRDTSVVPGGGAIVVSSVSGRLPAPQGSSAFDCLLAGGVGGVPSGLQKTVVMRHNASGQFTTLPWPTQVIQVEDDMGMVTPRTISDDIRAPFLLPSGQYAVRIGLLDPDTSADNDAIVLFEVPTPCTADTNGDGILTPADFSAWIAAFNAQSAACDQNGDGLCTPADFTAWIANYNAGC